MTDLSIPTDDAATLLKLTRSTWSGMKQRCLNPKATGYQNYGGRGIVVCERWLTFAPFLADMGPKPAREYTIERDDVNGGYEPGNCRWVTRHAQYWNKTNTVRLPYRGLVWSLAHLCDVLDINHGTMWNRMNRAIPVEMALNMPRTYRSTPIMDRIIPPPVGRIAPKERLTLLDPAMSIADLVDDLPALDSHALY